MICTCLCRLLDHQLQSHSLSPFDTYDLQQSLASERHDESIRFDPGA